VLGAGTMGRGIALTVARGGFDVVLRDLDAGQLDTAQRWAEGFLATSVAKGKLSSDEAEATLGRLRTSMDADAASTSRLVIEALPENLGLKRAVLGGIQRRAGHDVTIHTNTSTLAVGDIAVGLPSPHLVVGTHYCNPAPLMPLIEVAASEVTGEATVRGAVEFARAIGKTPVVLRDRPGLITNFMVVAFENEAIRMLEAGIAGPETIDRVTLESMRFPIGPFRLLDIVGLDVHVAVSQSLREQLDDPQYDVPDLVHDMVTRGELGVKTGRGFYEYGSDK